MMTAVTLECFYFYFHTISIPINDTLSNLFLTIFRKAKEDKGQEFFVWGNGTYQATDIGRLLPL